MKKRFLKYSVSAALPSKPTIPGVYVLEAAELEGTDVSASIVFCGVPNANLENDGGWNFVFTDAAGDVFVSKKTNPLYDAAVSPAVPGLPSTVPANYLTAQDAADAYTAKENVVAA